LTDANSAQRVDAGLRGTLSTTEINGFVWDDLDADGIREPGEPGVPSVVVTLAPDGESAVTGPNGVFHFANVNPGIHWLSMMRPDGYTFTLGNQGQDPSRDSDVQSGSGGPNEFFVYSGQSVTQQSIGVTRPGSVEGFAWVDLDANGIRT